MIPVTLWFRQYKTEKGEVYFVYNHFEDGHLIEQPLPTPRGGTTWKGKFEKSYGHRTDEIVPKVESTVTFLALDDL
jgi:hypothetical protein